jgi:hypothetical protein
MAAFAGMAPGIILALAAPTRADILFLNAGNEITGRLVRMDASKVTFEEEGRLRDYPRSAVLKIKFVKVFDIPGESSPGRIQDPVLKKALASPYLPENYPDDGYVKILDERRCQFRRDRTLRCSQRRVEAILRERAKDRASNPKLYYLDGIQKAFVDYARSVTSGLVSYLDDTSIERGSEFAGAPAYDRLKSLKFAIPNVNMGSLIDYRFDMGTVVAVSTYPAFGAMSFRGMEPSVETRLTLDVPRGFSIRYAAYRMPSGLPRRRRLKDGSTRLVWEMRDQPSFRPENQMPPLSRLAPAVFYAPPDSWTRIASRLSRLIGRRARAGPELKAKTREIAASAKSPEDVVKAIYQWLGREVKYQGVPMPDYSYVPKPADEVFNARLGNGLDKPFLFYVMLKIAGLDPEFVYVKDKGSGPFEPALPSLRQLSAAAVLVDLGGRRVFIAPGDDVWGWLDLPGSLQGVHGLVVAGREKGKIVETPLLPAASEGARQEARYALDASGNLHADVTLLPLGAEAASWRGLKDMTKEEIDRYFEEFVHDIHPGARLASYALENLEDLTRGVRVRVSYGVKSYALAVGRYMAFRLPWTQRGAGDVGAPARTLPLFWFARGHEEREDAVALPRGYAVAFSPPPVDIRGPGSSYRASYAVSPLRLGFREDMTREAVELPASDYAAYKRYRESVAAFARQWIVLRKE